MFHSYLFAQVKTRVVRDRFDPVCGRYAAAAAQDTLVEEFRIDEIAGPLPPAKYNLAPTDEVPAVWERPVKPGPESGQRQLTALKWGLVPSWSKDAKSGARMINARRETVATKPAFRRALAVRRCLLPAIGYYEWYTSAQTDAWGRPRKHPFFIRPVDGSLFVMAGLYEFWRDEAAIGTRDEWLRTCTIITMTASDSLGHIHDRMPVTVPRANWDAWLDRGVGAEQALGLLSDDPGSCLTAYAVSSLVNRVVNDGPELIEPVPAE